MARIFGVIGTGKTALESIRYMLTFENLKIPFVIYDPDSELKKPLEQFCIEKNIKAYGIKKINSPESLQIIRQSKPDVIFSINNFRIIKKDMLSIPRIGIINYHNGPVPLYRGVNAASWAIINNERTHGVSWHFVDEEIDTGDIVGKKIFYVANNSTTGRLLFKCVAEGINLFKDFFLDLYNETLKRIPQQGESSYYSLKDLPENNGVIDFNWQAQKISRIVRALNYLPFKNNFVYARLKSESTPIIVNEISIINEKNTNQPAGKIIKLDEEHFHVVCSDGIISIDELMNNENSSLTPIDVSQILKIKEGDIIY